jgi:hypothetical protein
MSTIRTPVGPQPASVYWKRRLIVGLGLLAVIVIIMLIVFRPGSGAPTAVTTPSSSPSATSAADTAPACTDANISLTAVTDKSNYAAGEEPLLSMTITNIGSAACSINAGTDAQEYRITSGSDLIWTSTDCQSGAAPTVIVLEPGGDAAQSTDPFPWDRTRSSATTCDGNRPAAVSGGASKPTYKLTVALSGIESEPTSFLLG